MSGTNTDELQYGETISFQHYELLLGLFS